MNGFAKPYGFAICTVSCSEWKGVKHTVYLCCRSGKICRKPLHPSGKRNLRSKASPSNCLFSSILQRQTDGKWLITLRKAAHNYGPFTVSNTLLIDSKRLRKKWHWLTPSCERAGHQLRSLNFSVMRIQRHATFHKISPLTAYQRRAIRDLAALEQALAIQEPMGPNQLLQVEYGRGCS